MEKYCKSCGRVFDDLNFKLCPYCGGELATRYGRQPIPRKLRHEVFKRDGYKCRECGASKDETSLEIDHIVPVARGGTNDINNLQTLCRECNRMKHTDTWVGGETDYETVKNELNSLKNQIKSVKDKLKHTANENDKIEYRYRLMKLEERLAIVEKEYDKLYEENKQFEAKREKEEKRNQLYKKMYVEIDEDAFLKWSIDNFVEYDTKEEFIKYACDCSENEINNYIYTINLYKELLDNPEKLSIYNKLYYELDEESLEILNNDISQNFSKGLLILNCLNRYDETKIRRIIKNEKENRHKIRQLKLKRNKILETYRKHHSLSKTAKKCGIAEEELYCWYIEGKDGNPDHIEFYKKINAIKMPTVEDRKKMNEFKMKDNLTVAEKQKIVLENLKSFHVLEYAAEYSNIPIDTVMKWYNYGERGMVEFTNFYKQVNKILKSKEDMKIKRN